MCKCNTNNTQTTTQCHVCHQKPKCPSKEPCDCAVKDLSTNCILYDQEDLPCSNIKSGQSLSAILLQLDTFICNLKDELMRMFTLKNIGNGARIYKGIDTLGRKELRTVTKTGNLVTVTENTNDISISIDEENLDTFIEENQKTYSVNNIGTGVQIYKNSNVSGNNTQFNFRSIKSDDNSVTVTQEGDYIDLKVGFEQNQTYLEEGNNITITGDGTESSPYLISTQDQISLENGITTTVIGDGLTTPYSVETVNLQKIVSTFPYTLTNSDDKYTIFVNNNSSNVIINIPDNLISNFSVAFIQEGSGDVSFNTTGTAILNTSIGFKIKGQNYWTLLEKKQNSEIYYLIGSTRL